MFWCSVLLNRPVPIGSRDDTHEPIYVQWKRGPRKREHKAHNAPAFDDKLGALSRRRYSQLFEVVAQLSP